MQAGPRFGQTGGCAYESLVISAGRA
jgi:hypothetical protein